MLNVYLTPKRSSLYQPSEVQLFKWLISLKQSGLFDLPRTLLNPLTEEFCLEYPLMERLQSGQTIELSPGIAISHLFNQHAHDALVPAELTLEALSICFAQHPTLLPIEESEGEARCPHCGDEVREEELQRAIARLDLFSLESVTIYCPSCDDECQLKKIEFEPSRTFSRFWICLEQSASSRLSAHVLKAWESALGSPLAQLNAQRDEFSHLDEVNDLNYTQGFSDPIFSSTSREHYRNERWERRRRGSKSPSNKRSRRR